MSIVPTASVDPRRVAAGAEGANEEAPAEATFGMALLLAVAAQQSRPETVTPLLSLDPGVLAGEEAAVAAEEGGTPAGAELDSAGQSDGTARAARVLVVAAGAARLLAGTDGSDPALAGAPAPGLEAPATRSDSVAPPIRLPGVPDPIGRTTYSAPVSEPVPATLVPMAGSAAAPGTDATVLAASSGSTQGAVTAARAAREAAGAIAAEPAAATPDASVTVRSPVAVASSRAVSGDAAGDGEAQTHGGGERSRRGLRAPVVAGESAPPPAERTAAPVLPLASPRAQDATLATAAVRAAGVHDPLPPALENPASSATQAPGRVTLHFEGEGGLEGRLRIALRGPDLHATIVSAPETLPALEGGLGDLRRALMDRGFPNVHLAVRATPTTEAEAATTGRRSESGTEGRSEPRSRREDESTPKEQRPRGRDPRRSPER